MDKQSPNAPFWLVWNPVGHNPAYKHNTEDSAITEAERLAKAHPGATFIVLESVCARKVDSMQRVDLRPALDMPF